VALSFGMRVARAVLHVIGIVGERIVGEDKFAFNNTREATLCHDVLGCWPPFAGACAICHGFSATLPSASGTRPSAERVEAHPSSSSICGPSFSPECGHRAVSRKEVARAFFLLRRMQSGSTRVLF
jgi:hypothetical protein